MTNDDHAVPVYHDRLHKAELADALRHVSHLRGVVLFCIGAIRRQLRQPSVFNSHDVTSCARFGHQHLRLCGTGGHAARTAGKGKEYFRSCPPRKTAASLKLPGDSRAHAQRGTAQTRKSLECLGPPRVATRTRGAFFRGGVINPTAPASEAAQTARIAAGYPDAAPHDNACRRPPAVGNRHRRRTAPGRDDRADA